jgi:hypothetical protein
MIQLPRQDLPRRHGEGVVLALEAYKMQIFHHVSACSGPVQNCMFGDEVEE